MSEVAKALAEPQVLGNAFSILYTAPNVAGGSATVSRIALCNTDTVDRTIQICLVPSGGAPDYSKAVWWNKTLNPGENYNFSVGWILNQNWTIHGLASVANKVSVHLFGIEVNPSA